MTADELGSEPLESLMVESHDVIEGRRETTGQGGLDWKSLLCTKLLKTDFQIPK